MEAATTGSGNEQDFSASGVVLMKGHPHHPALHHHGLGELRVSSEQVKLLVYHSDEVLAESPVERVTLGTSSTMEEFGSVVFVDFGGVRAFDRQVAVLSENVGLRSVRPLPVVALRT